MTNADTLEEGYRADLGTTGEVHDIDASSHEVAVDFPHNVLDSYRTDWGKGCWNESFARQLPVMVVNHNPDMLIGSGARNEDLGDRSRLIGRFANFAKVPKAEETFSLLQDGHYPGWSFHYRNGRTIEHPNVRGARRFTKADMLEFSPVPFPSIPGAKHVGIRSEETTLEIPTLAEILQLKHEGILAEEGARSLIAEHYPQIREHIHVTVPAPKATAAEEALIAAAERSGLRDLTLSIDSDGQVTTGAPAAAAADTEAVEQLAVGAYKCLRTADVYLDADGVRSGLPGLPEAVQQAVALIGPGATAVEELLVVLGVELPAIDGPDGTRAQMSSSEMNDLPDSDFAYIEPGGTKDGSGKTVPRDKRHFPIQDAAHVRNALARIAQGADFAKEATPAVEAAAKKFGVDMADKSTGKRSGDGATETALDAGFADAMAKLNKRLPAA